MTYIMSRFLNSGNSTSSNKIYKPMNGSMTLRRELASSNNWQEYRTIIRREFGSEDYYSQKHI